MNWLREKGRDASPCWHRAWMSHGYATWRAGRRASAVVMWAMPGNWPRFLTIWRPTAAFAGAIHAAGVLADAPLQELDDHQLAAVFAVKRRRQANCCKPCATTTDAILFSTLPLPPPSARRVKRPCAGLRLTGQAGPAVSTSMRRKRSLSPGRMGRKRSGGHARKCWRRSPAEYGRVKRCRRLLALEQAVMRSARGDWRCAFYRQNAPLQQALFNISATEKPQRRSFLLLMTTPLTAA